jgi:hypothetical protein
MDITGDESPLAAGFGSVYLSWRHSCYGHLYEDSGLSLVHSFWRGLTGPRWSGNRAPIGVSNIYNIIITTQELGRKVGPVDSGPVGCDVVKY